MFASSNPTREMCDSAFSASVCVDRLSCSAKMRFVLTRSTFHIDVFTFSMSDGSETDGLVTGSLLIPVGWTEGLPHLNHMRLLVYLSVFTWLRLYVSLHVWLKYHFGLPIFASFVCGRLSSRWFTGSKHAISFCGCPDYWIYFPFYGFSLVEISIRFSFYHVGCSSVFVD